MPGPFEATGAQKLPTRYGALGMGARQFTGLVTQRSPYRDGAVPYLVGKFYGGSRFDTLWDGLNREITQRLTDARAPGSSVYNDTANFPPMNSLYSDKYLVNGAEQIRVIGDGQAVTGAWVPAVFDITAGQSSILYEKPAGAGKSRFLSVGNELFWGDGVQPKKLIQPSKIWKATTKYNAGDLILDSNGALQQAFSAPLVRNILSVQLFNITEPGGAPDVYVQIVLDGFMTFPSGGLYNVTLAGLTTATFLNGETITGVVPAGSSGTIMLGRTTVTHADYPATPDSGTATGITTVDDATTGYLGATGGTEPVWGTAQQALTVDGGITWQCYGNPVKDWGLISPVMKPTVTAADETELYWQPNTTYATYSAILDANGAVQVILGSALTTGFIQPTWNTQMTGFTPDGEGADGWSNAGVNILAFIPNGVPDQGSVLLDTNGNLQLCTFTGTNAAEPPTWSTTLGGATTSGSASYVCCTPGTVLRSATVTYSYSWHSIDGSVSNAAPLNATVVNGVLGRAKPLGYAMYVEGPTPVADGMTADQASQIDQLWVWRTAQGRTTLIQLAAFPVDDVNMGTWAYLDVLSDVVLGEVAEITAPINEQADPPPVTLTAPVYHLGRVWYIDGNTVKYSGGPDTVTGNGNTTFPPLNSIPYLSQPIKLFPVTVQNGGMIVMTTSGMWIILGLGTPSNPFYTTVYFPSVNLSSYDAADYYNNSISLMESNLKVSNVAIEYPFNPQTGYTEVGFPIGDQFRGPVTQAGFNEGFFAAQTSFLTWHVASSPDTAMYVSNGEGAWFRMSLINPPESGILWSPLRIIQQQAPGSPLGNASAIQSIEVSPGVFQLLMAPGTGNTGPILMRDDTGTVWDDNGQAYDAWDAKGVTLLCSTGQWASIRHISAKSRNTGGPRPVVSVLMNEIEPSPQRPYIPLTLEGMGNDPPRNPASLSVYSDRYRLAQQGKEMTGDCILVKFDYGKQAYGDELLDWGIYGKVNEESEEQAAKV